jgi:biopolymer transport protein ExbB/TolQ
MTARALSYFFCALLWLGSVYELILIVIRAFRGSLRELPMIGALLTQPNPADQAAPIAILVIFGWILFEILLHVFRIANEFIATQPFQAAANSSSNSLLELGNVRPNSRAGRRALLFRQGLKSRSLHEAIPGMAALDAATLDGTYAFIRVYVWILPVIGFIGTAWGMSHAIGGFSDALKQTTEVQTLTARLSQLVIPGLANAFSTTILALLAAIIGHFCASVLQTAEQNGLNQLDQACVRILARLPSESETDLAPVVHLLQQLVEKLSQLGESGNQLSSAAVSLTQAAAAMEHSVNQPYHVTITRGDKQ